MKLLRKYPYKHYNRFSDTTGRKYLVDNIKVPSVTTILSATKDKRFLDNWRRKVGDAEADRIMKQDPKHCLLYTSPSPRDRTRSRMPSSA